MFASTTQAIPALAMVPRHLAVIMDGNGRWAKKRFLPRFAGHRAGLEAVRRTVQSALNMGIEFLTLFAFSSENWRRPPEEVSLLMELLLEALQEEVSRLHEHQVRLKIIGDRTRLNRHIVGLIETAETLTQHNHRLTLTMAVNYGGRWDVMQAMQRLYEMHPGQASTFTPDDLTPYLSMSYAPEPDLFIRTGGEQRISNFLLWQLAYTELYFTDRLWPDFNQDSLQLALEWYRQRERRFGRTSEQLNGSA